MNEGYETRPLPKSIQLTDDGAHDLEIIINDLLQIFSPGIVASVNKLPLDTGMATELTFRKREKGLLT